MAGGIPRFIVTICVPCAFLGCESDAEVRFVSDRLAAIPGISVVRVWGNDDLFDTGQVHADIHLGDGTPAMLFNMGRESFERPSRVFVAHVGRLSPRMQRYGCDKVRDARGRFLKKIGTFHSLDISRGSVIDCVQDCPNGYASCYGGPTNPPSWVDSEPCE